MASQWGNNSLGPGQLAAWYFVRPVASGRLTVMSVMPLSPSFSGDNSFDEDNFDNSFYYLGYFHNLGITNVWVQLSDDETQLIYYMAVQNNSWNTIEYAFLEADL